MSEEKKDRVKKTDDFADDILEATSKDEASAETPKKKRGKLGAWMGTPVSGGVKRWHVTAIVAVIVVAVAGFGFNAYHNTPEFCGDICHSSMDGYVPTYYAEPGQPATDKWGNQVANAKGMLAAVHRASDKVEGGCMSCHKPFIQQQVREGLLTFSGGYYAPLSERNLSNLIEYYPAGTDYTTFCLNDSCHQLTVSDLTALKSDMARNPHSFHHWEYTCSDCHKSHRASVMVCTSCHDDAEVPEGWISAQEAEQLTTIYGSRDDERQLKS